MKYISITLVLIEISLLIWVIIGELMGFFYWYKHREEKDSLTELNRLVEKELDLMKKVNKL